ncbi:MAG: hypothetical protein JWR60_1159 [Polaromonas sp.]|nr:hypothetical protein [Polaromonas sp.]
MMWQPLLFLLAVLLSLGGCSERPAVIPPIAGTVWQPDNATLAPEGKWQQLGATELLVQWTAVDGMAFIPNGTLPTVSPLPPWQRIAGEPWASTVILGLAGRFDEKAARADMAGLLATSLVLAAQPTPLKVAGWYFPLEIDPSWAEAPMLGPMLDRLPRPLWISIYDRANVGPEVMATGLKQWLPPDVGLFFQDGVGVHAREAKVARHYADVLSKQFGKHRVRVIAEAFRPKPGGGFRSATIDELAPQLASYQGYPIYLFDGPHYLDDALVAQIAARQASAAAQVRANQ